MNVMFHSTVIGWDIGPSGLEVVDSVCRSRLFATIVCGFFDVSRDDENLVLIGVSRRAS